MKRYSVCQACGRPIVGVPTSPPFITLARATRWTHTGLRRWTPTHLPVVPKEDR